METLEELADKLEPRISSMIKCKIGKTGQTLKERYEQEYNNEYIFSEIVGSAISAETIDEFEIFLRNQFANLKIATMGKWVVVKWQNRTSILCI